MLLDRKSQTGKDGSRHEKARLEKAIVRLANAKELVDFQTLFKAFSDLMPHGADALDLEHPFAPGQEIPTAYLMLYSTVLGLRQAWLVPSVPLRRAILLGVLGSHAEDFVTPLGGIVAGDLAGPTEDQREEIIRRGERLLQDGFFALLSHALDCAPRMRICKNATCPHPYYLRSEGGKEFCSKACAAPAQRAAKLKWWNQHKRELLAKRRAEYRKRTKRTSRRKKSQRKGKRK